MSDPRERRWRRAVVAGWVLCALLELAVLLLHMTGKWGW
jgi:hypothetical protein